MVTKKESTADLQTSHHLINEIVGGDDNIGRMSSANEVA
jgi:hypothetical protein